jgi:hypothetical protein
MVGREALNREYSIINYQKDMRRRTGVGRWGLCNCCSGLYCDFGSLSADQTIVNIVPAHMVTLTACRPIGSCCNLKCLSADQAFSECCSGLCCNFESLSADWASVNAVPAHVMIREPVGRLGICEYCPGPSCDLRSV